MFTRHNSRRTGVVILVTLIFATTVLLTAGVAPVSASSRTRVKRLPKQTLRGVDAARMLHAHGQFAKAERFAYDALWKDIDQPEALYLAASSLDKQKKADQAAAFYALYLRTLGDDTPKNVSKFKPAAERRLKVLKQDDKTLAEAYARTAAGKQFESPEKVDDVWMNNVRADLFGLHGLYAWKLIGGRKDAKPDWVHNTQGAMHRSGMKHVDEAEGRKGVLFGLPLKAAASGDADEHHRAALDRLGHTSQVTARNVGGCKFLRVGARGYGFPFILRASVGGQEIFSEQVAVEKWSDLKIPLPPAPAAAPGTAKKQAPVAPAAGAGKSGGKKGSAATPPGAGAPDGDGVQEIVVELIVPEGQKWSEGVWIDYLDFFDD